MPKHPINSLNFPNTKNNYKYSSVLNLSIPIKLKNKKL